MGEAANPAPDAGADDVRGAEALERRLTGPGSPYALETLDVDGAVVTRFRHGPKHLGDLSRKAAGFGEKPFLVTPGATLSFSEVFRRAAALSERLRLLGVAPGARVAILAANGPRWVEVFFALVRLGAAIVLPGPHAPDVVGRCLATTRCGWLITDASWPLDVDGAVVRAGVRVLDLNALPDEADGSDAAESEPASIDPEAVALIPFTSGTTGQPKGVMLTHRAVVSGLLNMMLAGALAGGRRPPTATATVPAVRPGPPCTMILAPLAHLSGYAQLLLAAMMGSRIALPHDREIGAIRAMVEAEGVTSIVGLTPAETRQLIQEQAAGACFDSLRSLNISGFALHGALAREVAAAFPQLSLGSGYGMTETSGSICAISGAELEVRPGSSGRVLPTVDVAIVDPTGTALPDGEIGEIALRGAMVMEGYCDADGKPAALKGGWLRTGDLGSLSADRHLFVGDRASQEIRLGSRRLSPADLERSLMDMDGVEEASVVQAENPDQDLLIGLVLRPGQGRDASAQVAALAREFELDVRRLGVLVCDAFPRGASGKVDRKALASGFGGEPSIAPARLTTAADA